MSDFNAKMHQNPISAGAPPQTPLGSLQRSPDPYLDLWGLFLREKEWCDLENRLRVHSRSLKIAPFDRSHKSSY